MFRNWSISKKLLLVVTPPLIALIALVALTLRPRLSEATAAGHNLESARLATANMQFRDEIQIERDATIRALSRKTAESTNTLVAARKDADAKRPALEQLAKSSPDLNTADGEPIKVVIDTLAGYQKLRQQVDTGAISAEDAFSEYTTALNKHQLLNQQLQVGAGSAELLRSASTISSYLNGKDAFSTMAAQLGLILERSNSTAVGLDELAGVVSSRDLSNSNFERVLQHRFRETAGARVAERHQDRPADTGSSVGDERSCRRPALAHIGGRLVGYLQTTPR